MLAPPGPHAVVNTPTSPTPACCAVRRWASCSVAGHISSGSTALREPKPPALCAAKAHNPAALCVASACAPAGPQALEETRLLVSARRAQSSARNCLRAAHHCCNMQCCAMLLSIRGHPKGETLRNQVHPRGGPSEDLHTGVIADKMGSRQAQVQIATL